MSDGAQFVFGYGSLVAGAPMHRATLHGYRRTWGVAMDNAVDVPGYKSYRSSLDGGRPDVFVAFLDIAEAPDAVTGGALIAVDEGLLRALDARERNYDRIDVTARVAGAPAGARVWTYRGSVAGRARLALGLQRRTAVVDVDYAQGIRATLQMLGFGSPAELADLTDPSPLRLMWLDRVEIPPDPAP